MTPLFRNRGFLFLLGGSFLSLLAPWTQRTAVLIWVYQLTSSGVGVSLVGLAEALPLLVLAPLAGVFVDRWDRSRTMATVVVIQAVALLPLLLVHDSSGIAIILAVTIVVNAASQFFMPAASAALQEVVGTASLGEANSLLQIVNSVVPVIAPGAAGLLFALAGPHRLVLAIVVVYLLAMPLLARVPARRSKGREANTAAFFDEMRAGLAYVARSRLLVMLIIVAFVAMLGVSGLTVLDVVFVTRALHQPAESVGWLLSATGVGELVGGVAAWLLSRWAATRYHWVLGGSVALSGAGTLIYAFSPSLAVAIVVLFMVGLLLPQMMVAFTTMIQSTVENQFMGRVMSLVSTSIAVAALASMTISGSLTDVVGVRVVISAGGLVLAISGLLSLVLIRSTPTPNAQPDGEAVFAATGAGTIPTAQ